MSTMQDSLSRQQCSAWYRAAYNNVYESLWTFIVSSMSIVPIQVSTVEALITFSGRTTR